MRALATETIGTFFLVLSFGLTINQDANLAALGIGMMLMVMVYAGAPASGAHYNPAISLGLVISGHLPPRRLLPYWAAQFLGSMLASILVWKMTGEPASVMPDDASTWQKVLVGELVATFALAYVVMQVAFARGRAGNAYYGLAIGATVAALAISVGSITGGAFNPALGFGSGVVEWALGQGFHAESWLYLFGPCGGATLAAVAFRYLDSGTE